MHVDNLRRVGAVALVVALAGCGGPSPTKLAPKGNDRAPRCSPDGRYLVFQHESGGASDPRPTGIYRLNLDSLTTRNVVMGSFAGFDWIPGTDSIAIASENAIRIISSVSGAGDALAITGAHSVSVSHAGLVAFDAFASGRSTVFVHDRAASTTTNITPDTMLYQTPAWAPDDASLLVLGGTEQSFGILHIDPSGSLLQLLVPGNGAERRPTFAPAIDRIAWVNTATASLMIANVDGTHVQRLTNAYDSASWEHDGSALVYTQQVAGGIRLFEYTLSTGHIRQLTTY